MKMRVQGKKKWQDMGSESYNALFLFSEVEQFAHDNELKNSSVVEVLLETDRLKEDDFNEGDVIHFRVLTKTTYSANPIGVERNG